MFHILLRAEVERSPRGERLVAFPSPFFPVLVGASVLIVHESPSQSKVSNFDVPLLVQEDVGWLQIPVDDVGVVDADHSLNDLGEDLEVGVPADFRPLPQIALQCRARAELSLDHEIEGDELLVTAHHALESGH